MSENQEPAPKPIEVHPFIEWMGRKGWMVIVALFVLEFIFHGWAVWRARCA